VICTKALQVFAEHKTEFPARAGACSEKAAGCGVLQRQSRAKPLRVLRGKKSCDPVKKYLAIFVQNFKIRIRLRALGMFSI